MNRSTGESVKRSRSRPGNSLDGMAGAAAAAPMQAASRRPTIGGKLVMRVPVLGFTRQSILRKRWARGSSPRATTEKSVRPKHALMRENLDLAVDPGDHFKLPFVGFV